MSLVLIEFIGCFTQIVQYFKFEHQKARLKFEHQISLTSWLLTLQILINRFLNLLNYQNFMLKCFIKVKQILYYFIQKVLLDFITNLYFGYLQKILCFAVLHQMVMLLQM